MNAEAWTKLTDACRALLEDQHVREPGAAAAMFDEPAKAQQGEALATIRKFADEQAQPAESVVIDARLLRAAENIITSDHEDARDVREGLRQLREALNPSTKRVPVSLGSAKGDWPEPFLSIATDNGLGQREGAVLSMGTVAVLAGAGGSAKSSLALQLAVTAGGTPDDAHQPTCGSSMIIRGARTLMVLYEDSPQVTHHKSQKLIDTTLGRERFGDAEQRVHLLDMSGRPLYGTMEDRAEPMEGWHDLWAAVDQTQSKFIIIDPVLAAYVGESNSAGPVREFLSALTEKAAERKAAVLIIAHSTKAARYGGDPYDPGQIGGSGHWSDGVRGAMSLTREQGADDFMLRLAVLKSNYGPAYLSNLLEPIRPAESRMIIGLRGVSYGWEFAGEGQKTKGVNGKHATQNI